MWKRQFGSSREVIGRMMTINNANFVIVGVVRRGFAGVYADRITDVWLPLGLRPRLLPGDHSTDRRTFSWLNAWGRLNPGMSMAQAQAAMAALFKRTVDPAYAAGYRAAAHRELEMVLVPVGKGLSPLRRDLGQPLVFLMAVVALILLITSINLSSLLLTRTISRRMEMAIRSALGAPRSRLVVQLLLEGFILCAGGGVLGVLLAQWMTRALIASQPRIDLATTPLAAALDANILLFAILITAVAGLISGSAAAIHCSRPDLTAALKEERARSSRRARLFGIQHALVILQIALSVAVLSGAGMLIRNLAHLFTIDPAADDTVVVRVDMPDAGGAPQNAQRYLQLADRLKHFPGVRAVSASNIAAFDGAAAMQTLVPEGYESKPDMLAVDINFVGPGYHELISTPILQGRGFTAADQAGSPPVAIVNAAFARLYFPGQNPIGKKLWSSRSKTSGYHEIVGVAADRKYHSLREAPTPHVEFPALRESAAPGNLYLRMTGRSDLPLQALQAELSAVDARIKILRITTLAEMLSRSISTDRMITLLISILASIAFSIVVIGIYAMISHSLSQRTREIGIRIALGAPSRDVLMLLLAEGGAVALTGLAIGLGVYLALARFISGLLFEIRPTNRPR